MVSWSPLFTANYRTFGVDVQLTPDGSTEAVELRAIDKSAGVEIFEQVRGGQGVGVATMRPAAQVRASELEAAGLTRESIRRAELAMNGKTWRIERSIPKPTTNGEADGQLWLILTEV